MSADFVQRLCVALRENLVDGRPQAVSVGEKPLVLLKHDRPEIRVSHLHEWFSCSSCLIAHASFPFNSFTSSVFAARRSPLLSSTVHQCSPTATSVASMRCTVLP